MRSQFHHQIHEDFDERFPEVLYIEPFSPAEIYSFLTRWPFKEQLADHVARIYAELTDRPTLRDMCRNPLVLAMYVATDQSGGESSKADIRTSFYNLVVEELLVARRGRQHRTAARTALLEQRENILGELAFRNLMAEAMPANSILRTDAIKKIAAARELARDEDADRELDELGKETGIIDEERPGQTLRFIHLSFCEFLAAKHAARQRKGGWTDLLDRHLEFHSTDSPQAATRLIEVIPFAVALLAPVDRPDALAQVAELRDRQVLGRCFLETQAYDHEVWATYVEEEMASLVSVGPDDWTEEWLQRLQLFTVVVRDGEEWGKLTGRAIRVSIESMFSDLVGSDRARLRRVFSSYATHDPAAAFRLAEATGVDLTSEQPDLILAQLRPTVSRDRNPPSARLAF